MAESTYGTPWQQFVAGIFIEDYLVPATDSEPAYVRHYVNGVWTESRLLGEEPSFGGLVSQMSRL